MQVNLSQGSGMSYSQMMQSMDAMNFSQVKFRQTFLIPTLIQEKCMKKKGIVLICLLFHQGNCSYMDLLTGPMGDEVKL
jgi:hypothetical protein